MNMTRREALIKMAVALGATVAGPRILAATFGSGSPAGWTDPDLRLLDAIGDTVIPGAAATGIGAFIAMMVNDCYGPSVHTAVKAGLVKLAADYQAAQGEGFMGGNLAKRTAFLNALDTEQRKYTSEMRRKAPSGDETFVPHYFRVIRELTILGYFTSETGSTKSLNYVEVPGRFDGDVPYKKGDPLFL